jgi:hypothetical protein
LSRDDVTAYSNAGHQQSPSELHDAATRKDLPRAAIVTVAGIFDLWRLTNEPLELTYSE